MFLHYLRGLPRTKDWLNQLSWTNLPIQDARLYWFYAIVVPLTVVMVLYFLSRGLAQAMLLRDKAFTAERQASEHHHSRMYHVLVTDVPAEWDTDQIQAFYYRWDHHIERVDRFSSDMPMLQGLAQMDTIVRQIERCETSFINQLLTQSKRMHAARFPHHLKQEIGKRYMLAQVASTSRFDMRASVGDRYSRLNQLTSSLAFRRPASTVRRSYEPAAVRE
ncbi:hypothetical protein LTR70_008780 [Exophiala xenobiotica]|uniref:Uncharacterized protein n=1 Tax=Lithohypha guttulata TaxID=1690604 RepID=A0ABR0JVW6_9EURO|nr:hypothetical protein LTR24_009818 [Lithohypha guttulata]KAK5311450.1 hypothetical protein LTR70_008780 [Exophiala xenobiotica]